MIIWLQPSATPKIWVFWSLTILSSNRLFYHFIKHEAFYCYTFNFGITQWSFDQNPLPLLKLEIVKTSQIVYQNNYFAIPLTYKTQQ